MAKVDRIEIATVSKTTVTAVRAEQDGYRGYLLHTPGVGPVFVPESEADRLARFFLFNPAEPAPEGPIPYEPPSV